MADYFRLRQICLAAPDLPRVIDDMEAIFGVKLAYRDEHVRKYGLENALFPFGLSFVEVVSPIAPNTAAGRFIERSGGVGGYMAIFNCSDPEARAAHANSVGVPTANVMAHDGFTGYQLHPRDCRGAMIEFDRSEGEEDLHGSYHPAGGAGWTTAIKTDVTRDLVAIEMESPDPLGLGAHWSQILALPFEADGDGGVIRPEMTAIRFVKGEGAREVMRRLIIDVAEPEALLQRAAERGYAVDGGAVEFCGVAFRPKRAESA